MWGAVAWEKVPGGRDKNNPDASKQGRPTLGMPILIAMKKKPGVDQWEGSVYNAKDGKSYDSTIKPIGTDKLEIQGCVLGFLCGGETWTRIAGPIPSSSTNVKGAKTGAPKMTAPAKSAATAAPVGAPKPPSPKPPLPGQTADIGDICLLPDIAGVK